MITKSYFKGMYVEQHQLFEGRPTLIFLHDSLGCVQLWRSFPELLAKATQCNILMYDRLGYGLSAPMKDYIRPVNYMELEALLLDELLTHYQVAQRILFGHSDGGTIALTLASLFPGSILLTIAEAAHIFVEPVTLQGVEEAMVAYETTNLAERLQKYHGDKVDTLFKAWTLTWTRPDFRDWNIEYLLGNIQSPLLFVQGSDDEYGSLKQVAETINKPKGLAEQFILPGIGHTPHKEAPAKVLEAVAAFINRQLV
ncbi:MAG: alpha/beta hydrolase [Taibaiella sp.]|nr:alpha/beta hydrolase [Taibaiella sp.]